MNELNGINDFFSEEDTVTQKQKASGNSILS